MSKYLFPDGQENPNYKHGQTLSQSRAYRCWCYMRNRLRRHPHYRGVTQSPAWDDFNVFLSDVGEAPSESHTLGRINNNLGYEKGNVKWETMGEQSRNKTTNIWVEGQVLKDWSNSRGFKYKTVWRWIKEGKSLSYIECRGKELWHD